MIRVILLLVSFQILGVCRSAVAQVPRSDALPAIFQVTECPAVGEEYERMIAKLDSIKASVKENANCSAVTLQVESLEKLLNGDRKQVLELIERGQDTPLTAQESQLIATYAENITKKVSTLTDLFTGSAQCFASDEDRSQQLSNLAGFVGEAAQFAGSIAGPWGTPIAIGGNVIAGFMKGLDQVLKAHNRGYDFSKRDQWTNYVLNLCTYHSYRDQIDHLLNPGVRVGELQNLKVKLDQQIELMTSQCEECNDIKIAYDAKKRAGPKALQNMLDREINGANAKFTQSVGTYTLQNLGLRDWVITEIDRLETESDALSNSASGRNVLYAAKEEIESFLIEREAPRFLDYQMRRGQQEYYRFLDDASQDGARLYFELENINKAVFSKPINNIYWADELEIFRTMVIEPLLWENVPDAAAREDLQFTWRSYAEKGINQLRASESSVQVSQVFCNFFKHAGLYSAEVRYACQGQSFKDLVSIQSTLDRELATSVAVQGLRPSPLMIEDPNTRFASDKVDALIKGIDLRGQELGVGLTPRL